MTIAIDGPAGSGKSSVAAKVAQRLALPHVDSGAYYRTAALAVIRAETVDADDEEAVLTVVGNTEISRRGDVSYLAGEDVEAEIRGPEVTALVSQVARHPRVRTHLMALLRAEMHEHGGVVDGRDAATNIVPDARVKVWLDADINERARRRALQAGDRYDTIASHVERLQRRDAADAAQMIRHPEAVVIDTTGMSFDEVVGAVLQCVRDSTHNVHRFPSSPPD